MHFVSEHEELWLGKGKLYCIQCLRKVQKEAPRVQRAISPGDYSKLLCAREGAVIILGVIPQEGGGEHIAGLVAEYLL